MKAYFLKQYSVTENEEHEVIQICRIVKTTTNLEEILVHIKEKNFTEDNYLIEEIELGIVEDYIIPHYYDIHGNSFKETENNFLAETYKEYLIKDFNQAVTDNDIPLLKSLLNKGISLSDLKSDAIKTAVVRGHLAVIQLFMQDKEIFKRHARLLKVAIYHQHQEIIKLLIENKIHLHFHYFYNDALEVAIKKSDVEIFQYVWENKENISISYKDLLNLSIKEDAIQEFKILIRCFQQERKETAWPIYNQYITLMIEEASSKNKWGILKELYDLEKDKVTEIIKKINKEESNQWLNSQEMLEQLEKDLIVTPNEIGKKKI